MANLNLILFLLISSLTDFLVTGQTLECEFTDNTCEWNDLENLSWNIGEYDKVEFKQPAKQIDNGGFIFSNNPTKTSILESPILPKDSEPFCLVFNYYMFGSTVGSLELQLESAIGDDISKFNKIGRNVWKQEGSKYDDWIPGKYYFDPAKQDGDMFRFKFVATSDDIALGPISVKPGSCDLDYKCDFENPSTCFWSSEPDYNYRWYVSNGSDSKHDLVGFDATTLTEAGHFMRTVSGGFGGSSSNIISKNYLSSSEAKCLSFKVFKRQFDSDLLQFAIESKSGSRTTLWFQSYIPNQQWVKINLDIPSQSDDFKLILSAHRHTERSAPIAIDELTVSPQTCSSLGTCNFDSGLCDYSIKSGELLVGFGRLPDPSAINWTPLKNIDPYDLFVYTNTPKNDTDSKFYSLESPYIEQAIGKTCLTFSYAFTFKQKGAFSIKLTSGDSLESKTIWSLYPPVSEENWKTIQVPLPNSDKFYKYSFEFSGVQLFAAIDDIVVDSCDTQQQDTPVCSYNGLIDQDCIDIVPSAFNNWFFKKTDQLDSSLDPVYKFKNDLVLFFDEPVPAQSSSFSHFYIPYLKSEVSYCLNFWYFINGNIELSLWTDVIDSDFDQHLRKSPITTLKGHSGSSWDQAKIQLDDISKESKLIFGAGYSINSQGKIVIDGLELTEGTCKSDYFCDFEDTCSWNNLGKDKSLSLPGSTYKSTTEWVKVEAKNSNPNRDATLGSRDGHFLTLKNANEKAILTLPPLYLFKNSAGMCFSVNTYASAKSNIEIISEQGSLLKLIGQKSVNSMNWEPFRASVKFNPNLSKVARVYIAASGRLAIDDVSIKTGICYEPSFNCKNGKQIPKSQVCDFSKDCPSGEDEQHCGDCYFSRDFCGYTHDNIGNWYVENWQVHVKKNGGWGSDDTRLTSPTLKPTAPTCKLQFEHDDSDNDLKVLLLFEDGRSAEVWSDKMLYAYQGMPEMARTDKIKATVNLGRIPIPFSIQFYAVVKSFLLARNPLNFGAVKFSDCDYQDTIGRWHSMGIYTCNNGKRISQDQVCDQSMDCFDGDDEMNCGDYRIYSFEDSKDAEYWTNLSNEGKRWSWTKASGRIDSTPPRDHSKGLENSGYMAIYPEKSTKLYPQLYTFQSKEVRLAGPKLKSIDHCSMVFYYNIAGVTIVVYVMDNNSKLTQLIELNPDYVFGFKRQRVNLENRKFSTPFRFVFSAKYSEFNQANYRNNYYAVIDDIVISGSCFN